MFKKIVYGEWQDNAMQVKFTDIDYFVISDGASYVAQGESPFQRYDLFNLISFLN